MASQRQRYQWQLEGLMQDMSDPALIELYRYADELHERGLEGSYTPTQSVAEMGSGVVVGFTLTNGDGQKDAVAPKRIAKRKVKRKDKVT